MAKIQPPSSYMCGATWWWEGWSNLVAQGPLNIHQSCTSFLQKFSNYFLPTPLTIFGFYNLLNPHHFSSISTHLHSISINSSSSTKISSIQSTKLARSHLGEVGIPNSILTFYRLGLFGVPLSFIILMIYWVYMMDIDEFMLHLWIRIEDWMD